MHTLLFVPNLLKRFMPSIEHTTNYNYKIPLLRQKYISIACDWFHFRAVQNSSGCVGEHIHNLCFREGFTMEDDHKKHRDKQDYFQFDVLWLMMKNKIWNMYSRTILQ